MVDKQTTAAFIPAAGIGTRLGLGPKALLRLGERTLIEILIQTLSPIVDSILIATPDNFQPQFDCYTTNKIKIIPGGDSRQESIEILFQHCTADILLIQDVARPFASGKLLDQVLNATSNKPAAGAFLSATVPVGKLNNGQVTQYLEHQQAGIFQAPQAFQNNVLKDAISASAGKQFQSTAQMVISAGYPLTAVAGEPENIKITTALDWQIAQCVIAPRLGLI